VSVVTLMKAEVFMQLVSLRSQLMRGAVMQHWTERGDDTRL